MFGGILLYYFRPIQRYMDRRDRISSTEARTTSLFICLCVCYANFSNFAKGYRPEFSTYEAVILHQQSPRSNWISFLEIGGLETPLRGFSPLRTPQRTKKVAVNHAKLCETYSPWSNKIFGDNIFDQGHPWVELLTKMFGEISRKYLRPYTAGWRYRSHRARRLGRRCHATLTVISVAWRRLP